MIISSCPLRISLFGGSTDNPFFVRQYGYGSVISFTCDLKTYVTLSQDKFGLNKKEHKYIINYSRREEVSSVDEIQNDVVRVVLDHFDMPPVHVLLTSDAYSQGSGLASSSSYIISLIKACCLFHGEEMTETDICKLAHQLEIEFNPFCGYQDPYGCGVGGFKRIEFLDDYRIKYEFLPTNFFNEYDMHLVFTGVTRNSRKILKSVTNNLHKVKPLLDTVDMAHDSIISNNSDEFFGIMSEGWNQKKQTSFAITENTKIKEIDRALEKNPTVLAHKLCGAGNGGFFLTFSKKDALTTAFDSVKINVTADGVLGRIV
ncbi:D,D-heptose 7-phosphate kinase [Synechococcus phage SynMITS9220M01]|nr:D,D-heptose 7-phosphate kinase [Synechococcus phage SynMITS9220M01]|tara:strand:- start:458 stop:1405 length:948 start_codon:yes stop_codon:yes gene_type:complete